MQHAYGISHAVRCSGQSRRGDPTSHLKVETLSNFELVIVPIDGVPRLPTAMPPNPNLTKSERPNVAPKRGVALACPPWGGEWNKESARAAAPAVRDLYMTISHCRGGGDLQ